MTIVSNKKVSLSAPQYFLITAIASLGLALLWFFSNPILVQKTKVSIGLTPSLEADDNSFYQQRVQLVLDKYCVDCHNEEKTKGKLRLDAFAFTRYSGKSGHTVVPGNPDKSELLKRMLLPDDDKRLMPPLGWKHPTSDELKVIKMWINKKASNSLSASAFANAPDLIKEVEIPLIDSAQVATLRSPILSAVDKINALYPYALSFVSRGSSHLNFTNVSTKKTFEDNDLVNLLPVASNIQSIYLRNTKLSDKSLDMVVQMNNVNELYIVGSNYTANGLIRLINELPNLVRLTLDTSQLNDPIKQLCADKKIKLSGVNRG